MKSTLSQEKPILRQAQDEVFHCESAPHPSLILSLSKDGEGCRGLSQRTRAAECISLYRKHGLRLATAESCTGGLLIGCLTSVSGSSDVVERGYVTYSNKAKVEMLCVPEHVINQHGAVSREVAISMAERALRLARVDVAISVTGLTDAGGESSEKPIGLVYLAIASKTSETLVKRFIFGGTREQIRLSAVEKGLEMCLQVASV